MGYRVGMKLSIHPIAWKAHSTNFALTEFSEVVALASQLCYFVSKRSSGERVGKREE
jgi:hypothetical protein